MELVPECAGRKCPSRHRTITLLDTAHNPVLRWQFSQGWPSKWEGPILSGKSNEVAIETLVIEHEGLQLTSGK